MRWIDVAANIDEKLYGPLPDPDIVSTQGRYLVSRPDTPVVPILRSESDAFIHRLELRLKAALYGHDLRCHKYGQNIAEEWPPRHTPEEFREAYEEKQRIFEELLEAPTPDDDGIPITTERQLPSPLPHTPPRSSESPKSQLPNICANTYDEYKSSHGIKLPISPSPETSIDTTDAHGLNNNNRVQSKTVELDVSPAPLATFPPESRGDEPVHTLPSKKRSYSDVTDETKDSPPLEVCAKRFKSYHVRLPAHVQSVISSQSIYTDPS